ncbi:hypothetical protein QUB05_21045 [Microcoleus sp. F10-C6]|uniref:hypothetical protein n=1 Tax=unclassified Microcoleus TaxID=2642155 RepID=UPI002FD17D60
MKTTLNVPIVKKNESGSWEQYRAEGALTIEADGRSSWSEFKELVNERLAEIDAEYKLVSESQRLEGDIVTAKAELSEVESRLQLAKNQLDRLSKFLKGFGIDPQRHHLMFDEHIKLASAAQPAEVVDLIDRIPF